MKNIKKILCSIFSTVLLGTAVGFSLSSQRLSNVEETRAVEEAPYTFNMGDWTTTKEGGEDVFNGSGFISEVVWNEATTKTLIKGSLRLNAFNGTDHGPRLLVRIDGIDHCIDLGLLNESTGQFGIRLRIDGGWNAVDRSFYGKVGDWMNVAMGFKENGILVYFNDILVYDYACTLANPNCEKYYGYQSWEGNVSYKTPVVTDYVAPTVSEPKDNTDFGTLGDLLIDVEGENYRSFEGYDFTDQYIGRHTFTNTYKEAVVSFDVVISVYGGDSNIGFYGVYGDDKYAFRFTQSGVVICKDGGDTYAQMGILLPLTKYHVDCVFGVSELALFLNGEKAISAPTPGAPVAPSAIHSWNWNLYAYVRNLNCSARDVTESVQSFVDNRLHLSDYTESAGSCLGTNGYYAVAKKTLMYLGEDYVTEFTTNTDFAAAKARYEAWAVANGDAGYAYVNDFTHLGSPNANFSLSGVSTENMTIVIVVSVVLAAIAFGILFSKKKKEF